MNILIFNINIMLNLLVDLYAFPLALKKQYIRITHSLSLTNEKLNKTRPAATALTGPL